MTTTAVELSGPRRAATVMLLLGEELSAPLWKYFDGEEVKRLSIAMMELGEVPSAIIPGIVERFSSEVVGYDRFVGNFERTEVFLRQVLPQDKADAIINDIRERADQSVWKRLTSTDASALSAYLNGEHPQTVALILSKLPPALASRLISSGSHDRAVDIIRRMININSVPREAFEDLERTLEEELLSGSGRTSQRDAYAGVAEIVNTLDKPVEEYVLTNLEKSYPEAATRIKELMFTFDDVSALPDNVIQTIIRFVDKDVLAQALRGTSEGMKSRFLKNMSTRASANMAKDIEAMGPMRAKDIEEARASIVRKVKDLEAAGEIVIGNDDEFI